MACLLPALARQLGGRDGRTVVDTIVGDRPS